MSNLYKFISAFTSPFPLSLFLFPDSLSRENRLDSSASAGPDAEPKFQFQPVGVGVGGNGVGIGDPLHYSQCSLDSFIEASKWTSFFNSPVHSDSDTDDDDDDSESESDCEDDDEEEDEEDQPSGDSGVGSSYSGEFYSNYFDRDNIRSFMIGKYHSVVSSCFFFIILRMLHFS